MNNIKFTILEIEPWPNKSVPRICVLKDINSGFESKYYLFPFINNMISAQSVNDELTMLTGYSVLLKAEDGFSLDQLKAGNMLIFPF